MPTVHIDPTLDLFYEDDYFGEPWIRPETILLIHGISESSRSWFAWVPPLSRHFRVLRPDWRGFGRSTVPPPDYAWSTAGLAGDLKAFLDRLGVKSAHVVGAKYGGSLAFQFAADYPAKTRTLSIFSGPSRSRRTGGSMDLTSVSSGIHEMGAKGWAARTQRSRLGSHAAQEQIDWWTEMMGEADPRSCAGVGSLLPGLDLSPLLSRIEAPTLLVTTDRSPLQSVETVREVQRQIPKAELVVLPDDSYHIAAVQPDECARQLLEFIKRQKGGDTA